MSNGLTRITGSVFNGNEAAVGGSVMLRSLPTGGRIIDEGVDEPVSRIENCTFVSATSIIDTDVNVDIVNVSHKFLITNRFREFLEGVMLDFFRQY